MPTALGGNHEAPLALGRGWAGGVGGLVVAGGSDFFRKTVFRDAAAYNPSTGTWRRLPQMPRALTGGPALRDGKRSCSSAAAAPAGWPTTRHRTAGGCCPPCRCRVSSSRPCGPVTACSSGAGLPAPPPPGHPLRTGRPITRPPAGGRPCPLHLCMAVPSPPQCGPAARCSSGAGTSQERRRSSPTGQHTRRKHRGCRTAPHTITKAPRVTGQEGPS